MAGELSWNHLVEDIAATGLTVERTAVYPKDQVPPDALYDDPGYPALRLVTCGGRFDRKKQEYASNSRSTAHRVPSHRASTCRHTESSRRP